MRHLTKMGLSMAIAVACTASAGAAWATMGDKDRGGQGGGGGATTMENRSIVGIVGSDPRFSTLNKALKATGLDRTLTTVKDVTVFAPTNEAFSALPADQLNQLMTPAGRAQLTQILRGHVVQGAVMSSALSDNQVKRTLSGTVVAFDVPSADQMAQTGGGGGQAAPQVKVGRANIIEADVQASNGVIHVIDQVLLP
jgi:uncharacterized surface protein with fasciclin (FAS1) repeats